MAKKRIWMLLLLALLILTMGCKAQEKIKNQGQNNLETLTDKTVTVSAKEGVPIEEVNRLSRVIQDVYAYFETDMNDFKPVSFQVTTYSKIDKQKNIISFDYRTVSDEDVADLILRYEYGDYSSYGLKQGILAHMMESKPPYDYIDLVANLPQYWPSMYLSYVNFHQPTADKKEISLSESLAYELVTYIYEKEGANRLHQLMHASSQPETSHKLTYYLDEWAREHLVLVDNHEKNVSLSFNMYPKEGTLEFKNSNQKWLINLHLEDILMPSIYESSQVFYDYIQACDAEVVRLEKLLDFNHQDLSPLLVTVYSQGFMDIAGAYRGGGDMRLSSISSFSHEYIHYYDAMTHKLNRTRAMEEIRAVYFSRLFSLWQDYAIVECLHVSIPTQVDYLTSQGAFDPLKTLERYYKRPMKVHDQYQLYADLVSKATYSINNDMVDILHIDETTGYYFDQWYSLMNFIVRNHGLESVDTIFYDGKLYDGSSYTLEEAVQDWLVFIINLSEEDYSLYTQESM